MKLQKNHSKPSLNANYKNSSSLKSNTESKAGVEEAKLEIKSRSMFNKEDRLEDNKEQVILMLILLPQKTLTKQ